MDICMSLCSVSRRRIPSHKISLFADSGGVMSLMGYEYLIVASLNASRVGVLPLPHVCSSSSPSFLPLFLTSF